MTSIDPEELQQSHSWRLQANESFDGIWSNQMSTLRVNNVNEVGGDSVITAGILDSGSLPTGSILQVVQGTHNSITNTTSTSYQDTGLSVSITPSSSTSKIIVLATQTFRVLLSGSDDIEGRMQLVRDATSLRETNLRIRATAYSGSLVNSQLQTISYLDSPASTSALTYKTQMKVQLGAGAAVRTDQVGPSTIIAMEVAA